MAKDNIFQIEDPQIYYKSSENMEEIKDNSIQLIVTSPPYGKIKDYGTDDQIGFSDSFETYFSRLKNVWEECYRVLEPQNRLVINVGDQYLRTSKYGRYRILPIAARIIEDCRQLGFDFLGDIIWQKVSTTNTTGGCSLMGSIYYPRNGLLTYDYEHILIFKKHKGKKTKVKRKRKELSKISLSEWKKWYVGHWRFPGVIQKEHIAMFPEELPYRIIRMFSFVGDNVLDPFTGSGTTLKVAKSLARKGIGYEINEDFNDIINEKTNNAKLGNFQDYQYLLYRIYQKTSNGESEICFQEQNRKGILILKRGEKKIILDYLLIDLQELSKNQIDKQILNKLEENSVQHYLKQKKKWKDFDNYIITINSLSDKSTDFSSEKRFEKNGEDNKLARKIQEVLESHQKKDTFKFEKPLSFLFYQTIISKSCDLKELFKENRNILQFGDALRSKNNNRKNSNLEDFLS